MSIFDLLDWGVAREAFQLLGGATSVAAAAHWWHVRRRAPFVIDVRVLRRSDEACALRFTVTNVTEHPAYGTTVRAKWIAPRRNPLAPKEDDRTWICDESETVLLEAPTPPFDTPFAPSEQRSFDIDCGIDILRDADAVEFLVTKGRASRCKRRKMRREAGLDEREWSATAFVWWLCSPGSLTPRSLRARQVLQEFERSLQEDPAIDDWPKHKAIERYLCQLNDERRKLRARPQLHESCHFQVRRLYEDYLARSRKLIERAKLELQQEAKRPPHATGG